MSSFGSSSAQKVRSGTLVGIGLMLLGVFMFALNDVMGKWLVATYSVGQVLLLRSIAALAVLLPVMRRQKRGRIFLSRASMPGSWGTTRGVCRLWL